jgi:hypothetical protein
MTRMKPTKQTRRMILIDGPMYLKIPNHGPLYRALLRAYLAEDGGATPGIWM